MNFADKAEGSRLVSCLAAAAATATAAAFRNLAFCSAQVLQQRRLACNSTAANPSWQSGPVVTVRDKHKPLPLTAAEAIVTSTVHYHNHRNNNIRFPQCNFRRCAMVSDVVDVNRGWSASSRSWINAPREAVMLASMQLCSGLAQ